jgi:23S rRNA (cytosine1962-C5)-methyltransferase
VPPNLSNAVLGACFVDRTGHHPRRVSNSESHNAEAQERQMLPLPRVVLKKGKEKPLLRGHPWVFSGAVAKIEREVTPGDIAQIFSMEGQFLGIGHVNPHSQIIFRLLSRKDEPLDIHFLKGRISAAAEWRERWFMGKTNAYRMVNGEGDFLPGLILDRYGDVLVLQFLTAGMDRWKPLLVDLLVKEYSPKSIYERSDVATRKEEGLPQVSGLLHGKEISLPVEIREFNGRFHVDVKRGQKTGFYLDQRESRAMLSSMAVGKRILDCFCYTGAFSIHGGLGGAEEAVLVDSSKEALEMAEVHFDLNDLRKVPRRLVGGNVFEITRTLEPGYDIVVLDPPPFAKKKGDVENASRGYKELNLQAFRLLNKAGLLFTFSCSHHMSFDLFQKIVFAAAWDAGREAQLVSRRGHPIDHPISLHHPEGEYLKGLVCRVT